MSLENPRSTAKIAGHPLHPMLIVFPIAFWLGALLADIVYWIGAEPGWARASMWLVGAGVVGALAAALAGFVDFLGDAEIRRLHHAWQHMIGNVIALVLSALSLSLRLAEGAAEAVLPWGLALSAIVGIVLAFTGWLGGELVYRHRIGVHNRGAASSRRPRAAHEETTHHLH